MNNKNKFKKGDRVRISKSSEYYHCDMTTNPSDCEGTVTKYTASKEFTTKVDWDNGTHNGYRDNDLELATITSELTVDKEFVMQAYESACSDWKKKIKQKFPELFRNPFAKLINEEYPSLDTNRLFYENRDGEYKELNHNISFIGGVAGSYGIPYEAQYRGIYVNDRNRDLELEIVDTKEGYAILFKKKA